MTTLPRYLGIRHTVLWNLQDGRWHDAFSSLLFGSEVFTTAARFRFMIAIGMCLVAGWLERDGSDPERCWVRITDAGRATLAELDRLGQRRRA